MQALLAVDAADEGVGMPSGLTPHEQFAVLAQRLRRGRTAQEVFQAVVESAVLLVDGCDRAAIGMLEGDTFESAAATDDVMRLIDRLQGEVGEGPCLEASTDAIAQVDNDLTDGSKWPRLARIVVEQTPVRAMLAVPLLYDDGQRSGALDVFADTPGAFTDDSVGQAAIPSSSWLARSEWRAPASATDANDARMAACPTESSVNAPAVSANTSSAPLR